MSSPSTPTHASQPFLGDCTPPNPTADAFAAAEAIASLKTPPSDEAPGMPATPKRPKQRLAPARLFASDEANGPSSPTPLPRRPVLRLLSQGSRNYASTSAAAEATSAAAEAASAAPSGARPRPLVRQNCMLDLCENGPSSKKPKGNP